MYSTHIQGSQKCVGMTGKKLPFLYVGEEGKPVAFQGNNPKSGKKFGGRQFVTGKCKKTPTDTFSNCEYKSNPYQATVPYLKRQPMSTRKLGFGSKNASVRDEFTSYIRTQQYREQLKGELKYTKRQIPQRSTNSTHRTHAGRTRPLTTAGRVYHYDRAHATESSSLSPVRELSKSLKQGYPMEYGALRPSSAVVGKRAWNLQRGDDVWYRSNATRDFLDTSHVDGFS